MMPGNEESLIREFKTQLGPIQHLDCRELETSQAHRRLGEDARGQIHKFLEKRLADLGDQEKCRQQIRLARRHRRGLDERLKRPGLDREVREAVEMYCACLSAWSLGADLEAFQHAWLPEQVDALPVEAEDLATLLQADDVGCQTGVLRDENGAAILWHTEEDYEEFAGQRFDKLRIFSYPGADGQITRGFIYPDLLPGPTFGWQVNDYVQAIDTLHIRPMEHEAALLPNTLAWLSLYLGKRADLEKLAKALGPFQGGYALTAVSRQAGQVRVGKLEFANGQTGWGQLGANKGCFLFQTNAVRDLDSPVGQEELSNTESRAWNETRMKRSGRMLKVIGESTDPLRGIMRMMESKLGGESAYANKDVKARLVCRISADEMRLWVGAGAAQAGEPLAEY